MKTYTEEFKKTIVELYENGNKKVDEKNKENLLKQNFKAERPSVKNGLEI